MLLVTLIIFLSVHTMIGQLFILQIPNILATCGLSFCQQIGCFLDNLNQNHKGRLLAKKEMVDTKIYNNYKI